MAEDALEGEARGYGICDVHIFELFLVRRRDKPCDFLLFVYAESSLSEGEEIELEEAGDCSGSAREAGGLASTSLFVLWSKSVRDAGVCGD